ncbi:hypothetical protein V6N12_038445 [Hibiscus sabdariffa]|uniref:Uncharacterized protein n=1 Tax=Hibiscus sabdariffa TaxID=183260 RepID=A0ABR1Z6G3_9ROSI
MLKISVSTVKNEVSTFSAARKIVPSKFCGILRWNFQLQCKVTFVPDQHNDSVLVSMATQLFKPVLDGISRLLLFPIRIMTVFSSAWRRNSSSQRWTGSKG